MTKNSREEYIDKNNLRIYLDQINEIPRLTREQELDYARRIAEGDEVARYALIRANLRYVVSVAKNYVRSNLPLEDLINEGNIGLIEAVERWEPERGNMTTYSVWWIKQSILKSLSDKSRLIRLPIHRLEDLKKIKYEIGKLEEKGEVVDLEHVAGKLDMPIDKVKMLLDIDLNPISLEAPIKNSEALMVGDMIYDERTDIEKEVFYGSLKEDIDLVLETLTDKEADILRLRFGLNGYAPQTLREVGKKYGIVKERVRQIEEKAIERLRGSERLKYLEDYWADR